MKSMSDHAGIEQEQMRARSSALIVGTNSIGSFAFVLHGDGSLSCLWMDPGVEELPVLPCVQAISAVQEMRAGVGGVGAKRKDEATMEYQSEGQFAQ